MSRKFFQQDLVWRLRLVTAFFVIIAFSITARLFYLAVMRGEYYKELASKQQGFFEILPARRGRIFFQDRFGNRKVAAFSVENYNLVLSPMHIENPEGVAAVLADFFHKDQKEYLDKIKKPNDSYEVVEKNITPELVESLKKFKVPTAFFLPVVKRIYPNDASASPVLGYFGSDGSMERGLYGIESSYNDKLSGEDGLFQGEKDAVGSWVALGKRIVQEPVEGSDVVLTIDHNIQKKAEEELLLAVQNWKAESGSALVMDPVTGKVLALTASPGFNPNEYFKEKDYSVFKNPIVESMFELGSVFKPITMAAALNENLISPSDVYQDQGEVKIGGYTIKNFDERSYGVQTMNNILEKSLNTGAVFVAKLLGKEKFRKYVYDFGFGEKTGIDFSGEIEGSAENLEQYRDIDYATMSFGQGIAVTPIQMARAISAIANKGKIMRPYVVERVIAPDGSETVFGPKEIRMILRPETSETVSQMLVSVVRNGFEGKAGVKGYFVAGKTGTAQIPSRDKRGYSGDYIHTFVGYSPAFDPKFLVYIQINKPVGNRFAANTLVGPFHNIMEYLLNYYEVPPDTKE